jgi:hypothetical protein
MLPHDYHAVESWCFEHDFDTCGDVSQFKQLYECKKEFCKYNIEYMIGVLAI